MKLPRLQFAAATRTMPGEVECGDLAASLVDSRRYLFALADGVGHGPAAASAARSAITSITRDPWAPLDDILWRCHREIGETRGVALTLVRLDAASGEGEHVGVGNVDVAASAREPLRWVASPGIVGARVRKVRVARQVLHPGDLLVMFTDGVSARRLDLSRHAFLDPTSLASALLDEYASPRDDAACVVIRC